MLFVISNICSSSQCFTVNSVSSIRAVIAVGSSSLINPLFIDPKLPPFDPLALFYHISSLLLLYEVRVAPIPIGTIHQHLYSLILFCALL